MATQEGEQTSLSGSSKIYTEEHTGGAAIPTSPPTTTTPGEQQLEVGCDNADKAVSLSKKTLLATPLSREERTGHARYLIHAVDLSLGREISTLVEEQSNTRYEECTVEMMNEYEGNQKMMNMKLNDDQKMNKEQYDDVTVTPSVVKSKQRYQ